MQTCRNDLCNQGRAECPTPDACRVPELPEGAGPLIWPLVSAVVIGSLAVLGYVVAFAWGMLP